jgi:GNAT superfamily N-acetyltransferase
MLSLREIAELEEARIAAARPDLADASAPIGRGVMTRGAPGAWINGAVGLFDGAGVDGAALDRLIEWYASAGIEPRIDVTPYLPRAVLGLLAERGFVTRLFELQLFRPLAEPISAPTIDGLVIEQVDRGDGAAVRRMAELGTAGFATPGTPGWDGELTLTLRTVEHPRVVSLVARRGGELVGCGAMEVSGRIAALFGATVIPSARRLGIQGALLAARLQLARAHGCQVATIGSDPESPTERNVRRLGFQVAYTLSTMVRPMAGLVPVG